MLELQLAPSAEQGAGSPCPHLLNRLLCQSAKGPLSCSYPKGTAGKAAGEGMLRGKGAVMAEQWTSLFSEYLISLYVKGLVPRRCT